MASALRQLLQPTRAGSPHHYSSPPHGSSRSPVFVSWHGSRFPKLSEFSSRRHNLTTAIPKASPGKGGVVPSDDGDTEDGVSLGTMKLPLNTDLQRFEGLLFQKRHSLPSIQKVLSRKLGIGSFDVIFVRHYHIDVIDMIKLRQWANSLFQGANLPLPVPLKVDKISGGARLGFITIGDGETEVLVYIDCLIFPATDGSGPLFRAVRNGTMKDQPAPGEPRIMRSLLQALKKSAEIATV